MGSIASSLSIGGALEVLPEDLESREYKMTTPPAVPKKISRFQTENSSTPNQKEVHRRAKLPIALRFTPRKPMHSSTEPKNAYEIMKEASQNHKERTKKLVKKAPKKAPNLEQSSLYEDPPAPVDAGNLAKFSSENARSKKQSDKENADNNSPQKARKPIIIRV